MFCEAQGKNVSKGDRSERETVMFAIFALKDLRANEEVMFGWEWNDNNIVYHLSVLLQSLFAFRSVSPSPVRVHRTLTGRAYLSAHASRIMSAIR